MNDCRLSKTEPFREPSSVQDVSKYELDLAELWYRIIESWKIIAGITLSFTILALIISITILTPIYTATAKLYVLSPGDSVINLSDLQIGSYLTSDYQEVFKTWEVNEQVLVNLRLDYTYDQLHRMLTISNPADTRILYITVASDNANEAMLIANEYAKVAQLYISSMMATEEPSLLSSAKLPDKPSFPNKKLNVILGFLVGAMSSVGLVVVRFILDDKIKTADDIRTYAKMTTLAVIPISESTHIGSGISSSPRASKYEPTRRRTGKY